MRAELLTIGDELCRGEILDTNAAWLAAALWELSVTVNWMVSCCDEVKDIETALKTAVSRAELVLVSGGLGPTVDDCTVDVISSMTGTEPVVHAPSRDAMERRFSQAGYTLTSNHHRQVRAPRGATVYANPVGLAPGFELAVKGTPVVCMPGVPRELHEIFEKSVRPRIEQLRDSRGEPVERIARRIFRVFGIGESHIAAALDGLTENIAGATLHYQVLFPEILVKVVVRTTDQALSDERLERIDAQIRARLGDKLYGVDNVTLPMVVGALLRDAGATVATAESCTGGMVGSLLSAVPGASAYFRGGATVYSDEEKTRQLGVPKQLIAAHGAVSEACVRAMAEGARQRFQVQYAVAVSGIAGPDGGSDDKPVGTVWLAVASAVGTRSQQFQWPGNRGQRRGLAAHAALAMVRAAISEAA